MMDKDFNKKGKKRKSFAKSKIKSNEKVTRLDSVRQKTKLKSQKHRQNINVYYSFLTIILLICLAQIGFSAILNITKTISYHNKIVKIQKIRDDAEAKNKKLKREINGFSQTASLEAIARNNLKMAGENEVLVIINDNDNQKNAQKKKKKGLFK